MDFSSGLSAFIHTSVHMNAIKMINNNSNVKALIQTDAKRRIKSSIKNLTCEAADHVWNRSYKTNCDRFPLHPSKHHLLENPLHKASKNTR